MPEITIKLGDQTLQTIKFDGELLRIGRSRENDVVLENLSVSRDHAQIRLHDGTYILTDLNSANGTMVNGVRITKTEIVNEDVITIGKHKLHFRNPVVELANQGPDFPEAVRTVLVEPKAEAWLVVESGRLKDREFRITRFETSLGKAPTNDIVLTDDWLLAKKQAIILRKGNNAFEIQDMGGLRKVKVNGKAISEKADIADGDTIEMGGTKLRFRASAAQTTPTGRVPREIPSEGDAQEVKREAGRLDGMRRLDPPRAASGNGFIAASISEDSMDLEEGFQSIRMSIVGESGTAPAIPAQDNATDKHEAVKPAGLEEHAEPAEFAADDIADEEEGLPTPVMPLDAVDFDNGNGSSNSVEHHVSTEASVNGNCSHSAVAHRATPAERPQQHQPFEDKRSSTRRRRKHHQRAAQKLNGPSPSSFTPKPAALAQAQKSPAQERQQSELTSEKEIAMWEDALKNPSPAIQKQAVKMLKKLTGKDYEV